MRLQFFRMTYLFPAPLRKAVVGLAEMCGYVLFVNYFKLLFSVWTVLLTRTNLTVTTVILIMLDHGLIAWQVRYRLFSTE